MIRRYTSFLMLILLCALVLGAAAASEEVAAMVADVAPAVEQVPAEGLPVDPVPADEVPAEPGLSPGAALFAKLAEGGFTMVLLLLLSVGMGATVVERLVNLRQRAIAPAGLAAAAPELWRLGDVAALQARCAAEPSILATILMAVADKRHETAQVLGSYIADLGREEVAPHLRRLRPLSVIANLAPLLGLFGTVLGMIDSFDTVAVMGELGDASALAGGISLALVTTAGGLLVAIPAIALYHGLRLRTEGLVGEMTGVLGRILRDHQPVAQPVALLAAVEAPASAESTP